MPDRRPAPSPVLVYAIAALAGAAFFLALSLSFRHGFRTYALVPGGGDLSQALNAIALYTRDTWRWPLFSFIHPGTGARESLILGDGIPLLAISMKVLATWDLAPNAWATWRLLACLAQPVAAVWACRAWGVRHVPAVFLAVALALVTPVFLHRGATAHLALSAHWPLLIAIGAYAAAQRLDAPRAGALWGGVVALNLLVHPYMAAAAAILAMGSLLRRALTVGVAPAATSGLVVAAAVGAVAIAGGYPQVAGTDGIARGFGAPGLSADVLAAIDPAISGLLQRAPAGAFQDEGFNYWGAGLLATAAGGVVSALRRRPPLDPALLLACAALIGYALASPVRFAGVPVLDLGWLYDRTGGLNEVFRASGRFWWPVTYLVLVLAVRELDRMPRRGPMVAAAIAVIAVQCLDTAPLLARWANIREGAGVNHPHWQTLLAQHDRLVVHPDVNCLTGAAARTRLTNITYAATQAGLVTTSYPAARTRRACGGQPPVIRAAPGDLHVLHAPPRGYLDVARAAPPVTCRTTPTRDGTLYACSRNWPELPRDAEASAFTPPTFAQPVSPVEALELTAGTRLGTRVGAAGAKVLQAGWYAPEPWGTWSRHGRAYLLLPEPADPPAPDRLRVLIRAFLTGDLPERTVTVRVNGAHVATWHFSTQDNERVRVLPLPPADTDRPRVLALDISGQTSPAAAGLGTDTRSLGVGLRWIEPAFVPADEQPATP